MILRLFSFLLAMMLCSQGASAADKSPLGRKIEDFKLQDYRGKETALSDYAEKKIVVVVFLGTDCPLAKLYGQRLGKLSRDLESKGVAFIGIDSNSQDKITAIAAYARIHEIDFPILKDLGNKVADQFSVQRTPTAMVLDRDRAIRYTGRIDDQYGVSYSKPKVISSDLLNAINQLLEGKPVAIAETEAQGCFIGRVRDVKADAGVTFTRHIAAILNKYCVECHRPGEIAPFELLSYNNASGFSETILEVVEENRMPPWHADEKHGKFINERRLSASDKKLIRDWVKAGAPEGDPKDLPIPPSFPETGWQLPRKPDLIVSMDTKSYTVKAEGAIEYQYFMANSNTTEDKWIESVEVLPGNRAVVHHILVFALPKGARDLTSAGGDGVRGFLAAYVPGLRVLPYPKGMAKRLPAGSNLLFQIHYTPNGSRTKDLSKIAFNFTDESKLKYEVRTTSAAARQFTIPPGAENHKVEANRRIPQEVQFLTFAPHMHVRGKSFLYEAIYPDGKKETLLDVPQYDFNWQTSYRYAEPKKMPAGTRIHTIATFDNSPKNLSNPDPTKAVRWGDQTWQEMMIGYFDIAIPRDKVAAYDEIVIPKGGIDIPPQFKGFFKPYDKNGDGRLDEKEIDALPMFLKQRVMDHIRNNLD